MLGDIMRFRAMSWFVYQTELPDFHLPSEFRCRIFNRCPGQSVNHGFGPVRPVN